jgi:hypothetical protein
LLDRFQLPVEFDGYAIVASTVTPVRSGIDGVRDRVDVDACLVVIARNPFAADCGAVSAATPGARQAHVGLGQCPVWIARTHS